MPQTIGPHSLIGQYGYFGIFLVIFFESLGLPLPGETTLIIASGLAASGTFRPVMVWAIAAVAAIAGNNAAYLVGRSGSRPLILHHGRRIGITHKRLAHAEQIMARQGFLVVFLARFFPLLRQLNGLAAGTTEMSWRTFLIANALGALVWAGMWTYAGDWVGTHMKRLPWLWHHL